MKCYLCGDTGRISSGDGNGKPCPQCAVLAGMLADSKKLHEILGQPPITGDDTTWLAPFLKEHARIAALEARVAELEDERDRFRAEVERQADMLATLDTISGFVTMSNERDALKAEVASMGAELRLARFVASGQSGDRPAEYVVRRNGELLAALRDIAAIDPDGDDRTGRDMLQAAVETARKALGDPK